MKWWHRFLPRRQRKILQMLATEESQIYVILRLRKQLSAHHERLDREHHQYCTICQCLLMSKVVKTSTFPDPPVTEEQAHAD